MSTLTPNFGFAVYEGSDYFNPLVHENGNIEKVDTELFKVMQASAGNATELVAGTVHSINRVNTSVPLFHFTATGRWNVGDTMTVNGVQVSVLTAAGTALPDGAYVIGSEVFGYLRDTLVTIVNAGGGGGGDVDAATLEGHPASYFGTAQEVGDLEANKAAKSVGASVQLTVGGWSAYGGKYRQTGAVTGVTANNNIVVAPAPTYRDIWGGANVQAIAQGANSVTFEADTIPTGAMYANVLIVG